MVLLGYPAPSILDKKDYAAMTVLGAVMAGYRYPGGWLHNELRGAGLVYYVHAMPVTGPAPGYFEVIAQTRPDALQDVVARIQKNVERAKQGRIDEDEFRTAVERVIAMHAQENTTIADQAQQAAVDELYGLGYDYHKTFDARIKAVTLQDAVDVARKVLWQLRTGNFVAGEIGVLAAGSAQWLVSVVPNCGKSRHCHSERSE